MRLYEVTTPGKCPRTKAKVCECKSVNQLTEAEKTIEAVAVLGHGDAKGMISFKQKPGKATIISGTITGLSEGLHGLHIHEFGDLSDGCDSAGGHYNPTGVDHGDIDNGHVGDLGNITADSKGVAEFSIKAKRINLQGPTSIVGRAVVVHEDEDDLGKGGDEESLKTGNAGNRAGCGVVSLTELTESELGDLDKNISDKHFSRSEMPQVKEPDLKDLDIPYKKGKISIANIKPVQTDRVPGLAQKVAKNFYGKDKPFILDKNNYLVNGHHRYDAARLLGIEKVDAIKVDVPIELIMQKFSHTTSDTAVENINEYGVPDYSTMPTYKLKKAHKGKQKFFLPSNEPTPKGVQAVEDVAKANFGGVIYPRLPHEEVLDAISSWEYGDTPIELSNGYVINAREEGYNADDNAWVLLDPQGKIVDDGEGSIEDVMQDFTPILIDESVTENFADGKKKGKSRPGRVKRSGASCNGSVTALRKRAKNSSGEKAKMYHWCANMKSGKKKTNEDMDSISPSAKMADQYIKDEINAGKIKNLDELKKYILELRLSRVIEYAEDARALWVHHFTNNPYKLPNAVKESFTNLDLPTWMSHTSLEKLFAQDFGPRYGDYVAHMDLDSDDDLAMSDQGMGDMAFEMVKANDIKVMQKFLAQMPVQFTVDDLKLDNGIQVWHLVQQKKTVH